MSTTPIHELDLPAIDLGLPKGARVVVAMSGGVDSSVVAALVARAGYEAIGITLQLYDHGAATKRVGACCAGQDVRDARAVANRLGIPHYVLDYESRFRDAVIEEFADSYARGETPIPCVRCNQRVKFADLLETARDLGAAALATGHYVRRVEHGAGTQMLRGADPARDQSYFLFATTPAQLDFLRFPLGDLPKPTVRQVAAQLGLPVADKPDSQDICFVPTGSYAQIVEKLRPDAAEPGEIVHVDGRVLGRHSGVLHFTVGQRRGLQLAAPEPLYVVALDAAKRQVVVGPRAALARDRVFLKETSWIEPPTPDQPVEVKLRSAQPPVPATILVQADGTAEVRLAVAAEGVAPGQACVAYASDRVLGGGWIAGTANSSATA